MCLIDSAIAVIEEVRERANKESSCTGPLFTPGG